MALQDFRALAFPKLDEREIVALGRCARTSRTRYRAVETPFPAGDRDFKFFVVESGEVEIVDDAAETRGRSPSTVPASSPATWPT